MLRTWCVVLGMVLLLAPAAVAKKKVDGPPVGSRAKGERFEILCHFEGGDAIAKQALEVAEATWDVTAPLGGKPPKVTKAIGIHLYRTDADYQVAEMSLTKGKFADNFAFSSWDTNEAYLALQPYAADAVFVRTGIPTQTLRQVSHEAAHLVIQRSTRNYTSHPNWLAEGITTWVADQVMTANGWSAPTSDEPFQSTRIVRARKLLEAGKLPALERILADDLGGLSMDERYAVWWSFFDFLSRPAQLVKRDRVLAKAWSLGGGSRYVKKLAAEVRSTWGKKGLKELEAQFREAVRTREAVWDETYRCLRTEGPVWTQMAHASKNALGFRTQPVGSKDFRVTGSVEILGGKTPQMNLLLGRTDGGFVSLAFNAGNGVTIFHFKSATNAWDKLGWMAAPDLAVGKKMAFEVTVEGGRIAIKAGSEGPLNWDLKGRDLSGPWGVGVQAGGAGIWHDVQVGAIGD